MQAPEQGEIWDLTLHRACLDLGASTLKTILFQLEKPLAVPSFPCPSGQGKEVLVSWGRGSHALCYLTSVRSLKALPLLPTTEVL